LARCGAPRRALRPRRAGPHGRARRARGKVPGARPARAVPRGVGSPARRAPQARRWAAARRAARADLGRAAGGHARARPLHLEPRPDGLGLPGGASASGPPATVGRARAGVHRIDAADAGPLGGELALVVPGRQGRLVGEPRGWSRRRDLPRSARTPVHRPVATSTPRGGRRRRDEPGRALAAREPAEPPRRAPAAGGGRADREGGPRGDRSGVGIPGGGAPGRAAGRRGSGGGCRRPLAGRPGGLPRERLGRDPPSRGCGSRGPR
jgi:hypothetical protein